MGETIILTGLGILSVLTFVVLAMFMASGVFSAMSHLRKVFREWQGGE